MTRPRLRARVHLMRHGEVENPRGITYGTLPGFGLSERGRAQAAAAAAHLAGVLEGEATLVSSPLQRAQETAAIVGAALVPVAGFATDPELTEAGAFREGLPRRFAPLPYLARLLDAKARARSEAPRRVLRRVHAAVVAAAEATTHRDLVIVSHQIPIWMASVAFAHSHALARALPWLFIRRRCDPASVTTLTFTGETVAISYWAPA